MQQSRLPPDRGRPAGQATRSSTATDINQRGLTLPGTSNAAVPETSFSAFLSTRSRPSSFQSRTLATLDNSLTADALTLLSLACVPWTFDCLVLVFAGLICVGVPTKFFMWIPTLFLFCCRPSTPRILTSYAKLLHGDARFTCVKLPAKAPLHRSYELDSSQRHFCESPNSPRRRPACGMQVLPSSGVEHTFKWGCPYTLFAPWITGRNLTLHALWMSSHLDSLVLCLTVNWEVCLFLVLYCIFFAACLLLSSLLLILQTQPLIGDARSPETLDQIQSQIVVCEFRNRYSMGSLGCLSCPALNSLYGLPVLL